MIDPHYLHGQIQMLAVACAALIEAHPRADAVRRIIASHTVDDPATPLEQGIIEMRDQLVYLSNPYSPMYDPPPEK